MADNEKLKEQREYAWNYFKLHAGQRMSLFNFFVLISALLTAGMAGTFRKECDFPILGLVLGFSLVIIAFAFRRLDQRVGSLVKHAEELLKILESHWTDKDGKIDEKSALFSTEDKKTSMLREDLGNKCPFQPWICPVTYSECFRLVYIVFYIIGTVGFIASIIWFLN